MATTAAGGYGSLNRGSGACHVVRDARCHGHCLAPSYYHVFEISDYGGVCRTEQWIRGGPELGYAGPCCAPCRRIGCRLAPTRVLCFCSPLACHLRGMSLGPSIHYQYVLPTHRYHVSPIRLSKMGDVRPSHCLHMKVDDYPLQAGTPRPIAPGYPIVGSKATPNWRGVVDNSMTTAIVSATTCVHGMAAVSSSAASNVFHRCISLHPYALCGGRSCTSRRLALLSTFDHALWNGGKSSRNRYFRRWRSGSERNQNR